MIKHSVEKTIGQIGIRIDEWVVTKWCRAVKKGENKLSIKLKFDFQVWVLVYCFGLTEMLQFGKDAYKWNLGQKNLICFGWFKRVGHLQCFSICRLLGDLSSLYSSVFLSK